MELRAVLDSVLASALGEAQMQSIDVYTFALYHDHESHAVSVCIDLIENSAKAAQHTNDYNMKYFARAISNGDLEDAALWQSNIGRNLSLGDFSHVNMSRRTLKDVEITGDLYLEMVRAVMSVEPKILNLASAPECVLFVCSGEDDETQYVWSRTNSSAA
jgi:hypothetical protein